MYEERPELMTKLVNERLETPLMIAVGTNSSHKFVKQLVDNWRPHNARNYQGNNALHYACKVGNMIDAKLLVRIVPRMDQNLHGDTPVLLAAKLGRKDMLDQVFKDHLITLNTLFGQGNLLISIVQAELIEFAFGIVYFFPPDAITPNILEALATKQEFFPSGNRLGFCGGLIYQWMPIIGIEMPKEHTEVADYLELLNRVHKLKSAFAYVKTWAPAIKNIQDIKIRNELGNVTMKILFKIMIQKKDPVDVRKVLGSAIAKAVKYGIYELIEECILAYPAIIWSEFEGYNLFHLAIKERQVRVYNLVYQMSGHKAFAASELHGEENALHIAAKLAPSHRLSTITGAALQMQRELQWYKEVETFVEREHRGQQMDERSATSCTVVAALIVTITFAAAITVPGGNKDDGKPVFLNERVFMLFLITDAFALFSSSTSLLMFLGILTSRYMQKLTSLYSYAKG
ncbi:ankyrin repeat-containing domain, PGG domain protein [Tanacetum coccineum]